MGKWMYAGGWGWYVKGPEGNIVGGSLALFGVFGQGKTCMQS